MAYDYVLTDSGKSYCKIHYPPVTRHTVKKKVELKDGTVYARMVSGMLVRMEPPRIRKGRLTKRQHKELRRAQRDKVAA